MKRLYLALPLVFCIALILCSVTVFADLEADGVLTLEEAKDLALKNNVQYRLQDSYIQEAIEDYEEACDDSSSTATGKKRTAADKAAAYIAQKMSVENAASKVRAAIHKKEDMKRTSDYEVTSRYYAMVKAEYSLKNMETELGLSGIDTETAKIKYVMGFIKRSEYSQLESAYASSKASYNKALYDYENSLLELEKSLGTELDLSGLKLDKTFRIPDIGKLDMNKIKEGYLKNNPACFSAKEQYDMAEYKLLLTEEKYEDYMEQNSRRSSDVEEQYDNMVYDARKSFDDAEYKYNENLDDIDITLDDKYKNLMDLYESYGNQKEEVKTQKAIAEENKVKYQMGLIKRADLDSSTSKLDKMERQLDMDIMDLNLKYLDLTQYCIEE